MRTLVGLVDGFSLGCQVALSIPSQREELELGRFLGVRAASQFLHLLAGYRITYQDAIVHQQFHGVSAQSTLQTGKQIEGSILRRLQTKGLNGTLTKAVDHHILTGTGIGQDITLALGYQMIFITPENPVDLFIGIGSRTGSVLGNPGESRHGECRLDVLFQVRLGTIALNQELHQILEVELRIVLALVTRDQVLLDHREPVGCLLTEFGESSDLAITGRGFLV